MPAAQDRRSMFAHEDSTNTLSLTTTLDLLEVKVRHCSSAFACVIERASVRWFPYNIYRR